ncbi:MAG: hypothetical protein RLY71_2694 [Pseudomonadota bacterium]
MGLFDIEPLLAPLAADAPCGDTDLVYDPAFMALEEAAKTKPEQQFDDKIYPAVEPDWRQVRQQALALCARTRDLRVALLLLRSSTRLDGVFGAARGIELVHGLLERHWAQVYPQLDASDGDDPTERLNALAPLAHPQEWLADLRAVALLRSPFEFRLRDLELAFNRNDPAYNDKVPSEAGALQALADAEAQSPGLLAALQTLERCIRSIDRIIDDRTGGGQGPDLGPLHKRLHSIAQAARSAATDGSGNAPGAEPAGPAAGPASSPGSATGGPAAAATPARPAGFDVGTIASREDAIRALGRIIEWIERNDPSNPAPLLIKRAQRLINKSFLDILRDLAPDSVEHIEQLAGLTHDDDD